MIWAIVLFLGVIAAAPFVVEALRPRMGSEARKSAPGEFVQLSRGLTHYQWRGPSRGPVAVCVHGLTTPSYVWGPIADGLARMGFRVLTYDLYGRGFSDRPRGPQDAAFFITQLEELLESQEVDEDFTLLGYSMGGSIVTAFAAHAPHRVRKLVLLAPGGLGHDLGPVARLVTGYGWLSTWLMHATYGRSHRAHTETERHLPSAVEGIVDLQQAELQWRGFLRSVQSSMRDMLHGDLIEEHQDIAAAGVPVLAIWGREDDVIPITGLGKLAKWNREARQEVIEGAGHGLAYTHPQEVLEAMHDLMNDPDGHLR